MIQLFSPFILRAEASQTAEQEGPEKTRHPYSIVTCVRILGQLLRVLPPTLIWVRQLT
jgi:hypothetical protein